MARGNGEKLTVMNVKTYTARNGEKLTAMNVKKWTARNGEKLTIMNVKKWTARNVEKRTIMNGRGPFLFFVVAGILGPSAQMVPSLSLYIDRQGKR